MVDGDLSLHKVRLIVDVVSKVVAVRTPQQVGLVLGCPENLVDSPSRPRTVNRKRPSPTVINNLADKSFGKDMSRELIWDSLSSL